MISFDVDERNICFVKVNLLTVISEKKKRKKKQTRTEMFNVNVLIYGSQSN